MMFKNTNILELFPTKWSAIVFVMYMALFVNQGILVTASQNADNAYSYNIVTVVLLTELLKLIISVILYCKDHSLASLFSEIIANKRVLFLYFVPAFLYCLYNNLAFINLSTFDPTTYYLLLQFRVVITGVVYQVLFKKHLSIRQWFSLILLTVACMIKQFNITEKPGINDFTTAPKHNFHFSFSAVYILIQIVCSCFAGVYNEHLLKKEGADVDIYIQNVFMYVDSIVCNFCVLIYQGELTTAFTKSDLANVFTFQVMVVMLNNAAIGIITSFFLKNLNSIVKTFAGAIELMFTAIFCWFLFGIPIYLNTVIAISITAVAVLLYSQNPVANQDSVSESNAVSSDKYRLVESV